MANDIQNSIYSAINTILNRQMDTLALDKTVIGIIDDIIDSTSGVYRIKYDGGYFNAISNDETAVFPKGMAVYVQIPQNDMANQKFIVGRTYEKKGSEKNDVVISAINNYSIVGATVLDPINKISESGLPLYSYHDQNEETEDIDSVQHRAQLLYDSDIDENQLYYNIKTEDLKIYSENATAIMIEADFRTSLTDEQKYNSEGLYGISLTLNFENSNYEYGSTQLEVFKYFEETINATLDDETNLATMKNVRELVEENLNSYLNEREELDSTYFQMQREIQDNENINESQKTEQLRILQKNYQDAINNLIVKTQEELDKQISRAQKIVYQYRKINSAIFLQQAEEIMQSYIEELLNLRKTEENKQKEHYDKWCEIKIGQEENKNVSYILDSNNMVGSPMFFSSWSTQYAIFKVDFKHFKNIESILFYHEGFKSDRNKEREDIFIKNLKLYILQPISAVNGDYRLEIQAPDGLIFKNQEDDKEKTIKAKVTKKYYENVTNNGTYYWFKKDPSVISIGSDNYHSYGGVGWKYIGGANGKGNYSNIKIYDSENPFYKNTYKCVAEIDKTIILKEEFNVYNLAYETDIKIISDLGENFSFDSGTPLLTCQIKEDKNKDYEEITNKNYRYYWSLKIDNSVVFLGKNLEDNLGDWIEWDSERGCYKKKSTSSITISDALKQRRYEDLINIIQNVQFYNGNNLITDITEDEEENIYKASRIKYPMANVRSEATILFSCFVKIKNGNTEKDIGEAEIVLSNQGSAASTDFNLIIENGDQVFQYDEYGNPPTSPKLKSPLEIKPLIPHLYSPNGVEIASKNYTVRWTFPIEETLIEKTGLILNPNDNNNISLDTSLQTTFSLAKSFNEDKLNNQIICRIFFEDQVVQKSTDFFFGKVGNNGTNGTDIVAKIVPTTPRQIHDTEPIILYRYDPDNNEKYQKFTFNGRAIIGNPNICGDGDKSEFTVKLYQKNEEISASNYTVKWNIAGNPRTTTNSKYAKYLNFDGNKITWDETITTGKNIYILRAQIIYQQKEYYTFYGMPVITYKNGNIPSKYRPITINKSTLLKEVIYNADGRNPVYNHNQGIELLNIPDGCTITWQVLGGNAKNYIRILQNRNDKNGIPSWENTSQNKIYILPNDEYDGSFSDIGIKADIKNDETTIATAIVPISMSLNTFGIASLNGWDGVSVTIDEENGAVLAPQVGAGVKDTNNRFSGILMGKTETYTGGGTNKAQTGLFGYAHGLQSIFLDAETGEAYFGLPDVTTTYDKDGNPIYKYDHSNITPDNDGYNEGRIELIPGGVSKIGGWRLGNKSLYYTTSGEIGNKYGTGETYDQDDPDEYGNQGKRYDYIPNNAGKIVRDTHNPKIYSGHHIKDIIEEDSGILIHAGENPYISIKGRRLDPEGADEGLLDTGTESYLKKNDSLEIQLDPKTPTLFSIFRHNGETRYKPLKDSDPPNKKPDILYEKNSRTFLAGINGRGQLVANGLQSMSQNTNQGSATDTVTMFGVDAVAAFGETVETATHIGLKMMANANMVGKLFVEDNNKNNTTLFLTGSGIPSNEYIRPLSLHGKNINLYADDEVNTHKTKKETNTKITLSKNSFIAGNFLTENEGKQNEKTITLAAIKIYNNKNKEYPSSILVPNNFVLKTTGSGTDSDGENLGKISLVTRDSEDSITYSYLNLYKEGSASLKGWNHLYLTANNGKVHLQAQSSGTTKSEFLLLNSGNGSKLDSVGDFTLSTGTDFIIKASSSIGIYGGGTNGTNSNLGIYLPVASITNKNAFFKVVRPLDITSTGGITLSAGGAATLSAGGAIDIKTSGNNANIINISTTYKPTADKSNTLNISTGLGGFAIQKSASDFSNNYIYSNNLGIRTLYGYFESTYDTNVSVYAKKAYRSALGAAGYSFPEEESFNCGYFSVEGSSVYALWEDLMAELKTQIKGLKDDIATRATVTYVDEALSNKVDVPAQGYIPVLSDSVNPVTIGKGEFSTDASDYVLKTVYSQHSHNLTNWTSTHIGSDGGDVSVPHGVSAVFNG